MTPAPSSSAWRRAVLAGAVVVGSLLVPAVAPASPTQEATFQDDNLLVYRAPEKVAETLDELARLGVDRVRVSVFWAVVAPKERPEGFDAADPAQYPPGAWDRYDTVLRLARERGIGVNFNITTPAPDWATGEPERADIDDTYEPDPAEYGRFVRAVATRYDGAHGPARVDYWSLMNEPNQPGWLTPQWVQRDGRWVEAAPRIYRAMLAAAWTALQETGHGGDTILVGELAAKGRKTTKGETIAIDALRFVRRLYCLDDNLQLLAGAAAERHGCPAASQLARFPAENPALFEMTGWAHHPYELLLAPDFRQSWPDWVTMANLGDLQSLLRRIRARYAQPDRGSIPLYLTEFGYQTRPPDRLAVTPAQQARFLNHAEYLAYRRGDVRTIAQFLLVDDGPPIERTFQSGLRFRDGRRKPSYRAYQLPVHVTTTGRRRNRRIRVWGGARPSTTGSRPTITIEFRPRGSRRWRTLARRRGDRRRGYLTVSMRPPGRGTLRLRWNGRTSRSVRLPAR